jgi:hypothetical protein
MWKVTLGANQIQYSLDFAFKFQISGWAQLLTTPLSPSLSLSTIGSHVAAGPYAPAPRAAAVLSPYTSPLSPLPLGSCHTRILDQI